MSIGPLLALTGAQEMQIIVHLFVHLSEPSLFEALAPCKQARKQIPVFLFLGLSLTWGFIGTRARLGLDNVDVCIAYCLVIIIYPL